MPVEKRTELFIRISEKKLDNKFELMSLALTDVDSLDDTYNLNRLVERFRYHLTKYDVHGVFTIVDAPEPAVSVTVYGSKGNLFEKYSTITPGQVA